MSHLHSRLVHGRSRGLDAPSVCPRCHRAVYPGVDHECGGRRPSARGVHGDPHLVLSLRQPHPQPPRCYTPHVASQAAREAPRACASGSDPEVSATHSTISTERAVIAVPSPDLAPTVSACDENQVTCSQCSKTAPLSTLHTSGKLRFLTACPHILCQECVALELSRGEPGVQVACPVKGCAVPLATADLRALVSGSTFDHLLAKDVDRFIGGHGERFVRCPGCDVYVERPAAVSDDPDSSVGSRVRCTHCHVEFCTSCRASPFHDGTTCEQAQLRLGVNGCRFCGDTVEMAPQDADSTSLFRRIFRRRLPPIDCCAAPDCQRRGASECNKLLPCGHPCYMGLEGACGPCLVEGCRANTTCHTSLDLCGICFVDELRAVGVVQLKCGHCFHVDCVKRKLQSRWPGPRITFGFLNCPQCHQEMDSPALQPLLGQLRDFRELVRSKMQMRLQHEGLHRSERVLDPTSEFHNDPMKLAEHVLAYYPCFKCGKPYFGGFKQCEAAVDDDDDDQFNPEHLVCSACVPSKTMASCPVHGTDFIEYKCKFCCSVATYFCWGTTHFCGTCHRRQEQGDYLTKMKADQFPKCNGARLCPLRVDHPPNGLAEYALGCAICRREAPELR